MKSQLSSLPADIWSIIVNQYLEYDDLVNLRYLGCQEIWSKLSSPGVVNSLSINVHHPTSKAPHRFLLNLPHLKHIHMMLMNSSPATQHLLTALNKNLTSLSVQWFPENYGRRALHCDLTQLSQSLTTFKTNIPIHDHDLVLLPRSLQTLDLTRLNIIFGTGFKDLPPKLTHLRISTASEHINSITENLSKLPATITALEFPYMSAITQSFLKALPPTLQLLNLSRVRNIVDEDITFLPRSLSHLNLKVASSLTEACLPHMPPNLNFLCLQPSEDNPGFSPLCISKMPKNITSYWELPSQLQKEYARLYLEGRLVGSRKVGESCMLPKWVASNLTDDLIKLLPVKLHTLNLLYNKNITLETLKYLPTNLKILYLPSSVPCMILPGHYLKLLPRSLTELSAPLVYPISDHHLNGLPPTLEKLKLSVDATSTTLTGKCFAHLPKSLKYLELPKCLLQHVYIHSFVFGFPPSCNIISFGPSPGSVVLDRRKAWFLYDTLKNRYCTTMNLQSLLYSLVKPFITFFLLALTLYYMGSKGKYFELPFILLVIPYIVNIFGFLFSRFVLENFIKDPIID